MRKAKLPRILFWSTAVLIFIMVAAELVQGFVSSENTPKAENGVLDLRHWAVSDKTLSLSGQWEFYFGQFLSQADFDGSEPAGKTLQTVPGRWIFSENVPLAEGTHGFATYKLTILLPEAGLSLAVLAPPVGSNAAVYVDGVLAGQVGRPQIEPEYSGNARSMLPLYFHFTAETDQVTLLWHVSSQLSNGSGITHEPIFGTEENIRLLYILRVVGDAVLIAMLGAIGIYSLVLSIQGRVMVKGGFSLAFYCLSVMLYISTQSETLFLYVFPQIDHYNVFLKIRYGLLALQLYMLFHMARFVIGVPMAKPVIWAGRGLLVFLLGLVVFTRLYASLFMMIWFSVFTVGLIVLLLVMLARFVRKTPNREYYLYTVILCALVIPLSNLASLAWRQSYLSLLLPPILVVTLALFVAQQYHFLYQTSETMRKRLLLSAKVRDEFLAAASHTLQAPLNSTKRIAKSLASQADSAFSPEQAEDLALMQATLEKMSVMVRELTQYATLRQDNQPQTVRTAGVYAAASAAVALLSAQAKAKNTALINQILPFSARVRVDETKLVQVLTDLTEHALSKISGGYVRFYCRADGETADICIAFRGEKAMVEPPPKEQTSSLSLVISRLLAERYGGSLSFQEGQNGTRLMVVRLPLAPSENNPSESAGEPGDKTRQNTSVSLPPETKQTLPADAAGEGTARKGSVLVVAGDNSRLKSLCHTLTAANYTVAVASGAVQAMSLLKEKPSFDLCILATVLEDLSGYELCRLIRQEFSALELPILYLSALGHPEDFAAGLHAGANGVLAESCDSMELLAQVSTLVQLQKAKVLLLEKESAFLQAQISPHFLFNALNVITSFCYTDPRRAATLLESFSAFLRNSFSFSSTLSPVSVESELLLLRAYAELEQARFGERVQIRFSVDKEALSCSILPLTVQPLLENAIRHVAGGPKGRCLVQVSVRLQNGELQVSVTDDGDGVPPHIAETVHGTNPPEKGVGLWNISRRLRHVYGRTLHIDQSKEGGASIWFSIPCGEGSAADESNE